MPRTVDFWFALLLVLFGVAIVVESWRMPRFAELGVDPMSVPGLTPGLLAVVLTGLGLVLLTNSIGTPAPAGEREGGWGRLAVTLGLCLVYAAGLVGRLPFWIATSLFVFVFVLIFTWQGPKLRILIAAAALACATALSVTLLFEQVFLVRLP